MHTSPMHTSPTTPTQYLFDLGNSRLKYAVLGADGSIGEVVAIAHNGASLPMGWDAALPPRFEAAFVASVAAAPVRVALLDGLTSHCPQISLARTQAALAGVRVAYAEPGALGVDRFLAMLGARVRNPTRPTLVVGVGTAITLDLIDAEGLHRGGRIAPSPSLMREALHARAEQLPEHGGALRAFADTTLDALRSGCDGAALALIAHAWADARRLLGTAPQGLFHGGGAAALLDANEEASTADPIYDGRAPLGIAALLAPALVLEGLAAYARATGEAADTMPIC